jgi:hypothetical protein
VESDATLVFSYGALSGNSKRTFDLAKIHGRPFIHVYVPPRSDEVEISRLVAFVRTYRVNRLNVGGAWASKAPGIHAQVYRFLGLAFDRLGFPDPENQSPPAKDSQVGVVSPWETKDLPWGLSVDSFCELHPHRHMRWADFTDDSSLSEESRGFLLDCLPILKTDGATIAEVLPGGTDLLTFLSRHGCSIQLSWFATRLNVYVAIKDFEIRSTSFVHQFDNSLAEPLDPFGEEFDSLLAKSILRLKFSRFE